MSFLIFFLTLSVLVFVHEFGHFLVAKKSGVKVEEFGFGLPPRIIGRQIGETTYSLNLLPIGGFVKLKGEEGEVLGFGEKDSFATASNFKRLLIVGAGVVGNLLLAYLIFVVLFGVGNPTFVGQVKIEEVMEGSPAAGSGMKSGDLILDVEGTKVKNVDDFIDRVSNLKGKRVSFRIQRGEELVEIYVVPRKRIPEGQGPLGVRLGFDGHLEYERSSLSQAPIKALEATYQTLGKMFSGFKKMMVNLVAGRLPSEVTGVVGIYKLTSQAYEFGWRIFLQFVAVVSLNLFIFNLMPIPALDGGRLLFIFVEGVMGRKINPKAEKLINNLGLALLLTLFVLITIRDFQRF